MILFRTLLTFFCLLPGWIYAQQDSYIFHHLSEKDGLSNNFVHCFLKDSRGIMWVGTTEGLNRFDGSHFQVYNRTKSENSIINNVVHDLCEDKQKRIWGATENGIFCYDPASDQFTNYSSPISQVTTVQSNIARTILNIVCDKQGNIWATGTWTFLKFNSGTNRFEEIAPLTKHNDSLGSYSVRKNGLIVDPNGKGLWMATRVGIHFYDFETAAFSNFKNQKDSLFSRHNVAALSASKNGNAWFYDNTTQQIIGFDCENQKKIRVIDLKESFPGAIGAAIFEDAENRLWFSSWTLDMVVIDLATGKVTRILSNDRDPYSIRSDFFWGAHQDEDGTVWLGTPQGISRCNPGKTLFRIHRYSDRFPFLKNNSIRLIVEDPVDKSWWLVTRDQLMVIHVWPDSEKFERYDFQLAQKNIQGALPGPVFTIYFQDGNPLVSTHTGTWMIDVKTRKIIPFRISAKWDPNYVARMMEVQERYSYLTDGFNILKYDKYEDSIIPISYSKDRLPDGQLPRFGHFQTTLDNKLWFMIGFGWLATLDSLDRIVPTYLIKDEEKEIAGDFNYISADKEGNLWIALNNGGIYRYNTRTGQRKFWSQKDGLATNLIQTIIPDERGNVWIAGNNKFAVLAPANGNIFNFSLALGETAMQYDNGMAVLSNGNVAVSVVNDIVEFKPEHLRLMPTIKNPVISMADMAGRKEFIIPGEELKLDPDERNITLHFGMLTDNNIFPYTFFYKLDGIDEEWVTANSAHQAVYNKLPPGEYRFRLMARASNGTWQSPETILKIRIRTPFFRSIWFYSLMGLLIATVLYSFYRFRTGKQKELHQLASKAQLLEKEKALVMYEGLKQQLNPHFLFNSLTSLNSLIGSDPKTASVFLDNLSKTYRYILKSRDNELVPLVDELKFAESYVRLQQTRFEKGFEVRFRVDEEMTDRRIVPVTLQNMIENAIKHNIIDEENPLVIDIYTEDENLVVSNNLQRKSVVETSNKQGLTNLQSLYHYLTNRPFEIIEKEQYFMIKIPLL